MARHLNYSVQRFRQVTTPILFGVGLSLATLGAVHAAQTGHGRVISPAGSPLQVSVPLKGLTSDDLKVLNASVADPASWAQAGLSLPAPIETLSVTVESGLEPTSRNLVLRSTQAVNKPVVDVLIRLTTASGTTSLQSSYLVLTTEASGAATGSVKVARGDTLYAIALSKAVPGADIYQVMWSIYEANPQAFISENMNLLRAGATLNIPDAATMRAVDAKYARAMFAKHDQAFRARRGAGQSSANVPTVAPTASQSGAVTQAQPTPSVTSTGDQVRLDSGSPADRQADTNVSNANALTEMQSRVEALQKNVEDLKIALQKSQAAAAMTSGQTGSNDSRTSATSGASGSPGAKDASVSSSSAASSGTKPAATGNMSSGLAKIKQYASDHVLGLVLGISALLALIIAFLLRKAGGQAREEGLDRSAAVDPGIAADFDQKLQSIDLNLSEDDKATPSVSGTPKTGA